VQLTYFPVLGEAEARQRIGGAVLRRRQSRSASSLEGFLNFPAAAATPPSVVEAMAAFLGRGSKRQKLPDRHRMLHDAMLEPITTW